MQSYCGLEKRQVTLALSVGGLDGSLPQIFSYLKNLGIPSAFSDFTLVLFSLWSAVVNAHKTVFSGYEAQWALPEGKEPEHQDSRVMRARRMSIKQCFNFLLTCAD